MARPRLARLLVAAAFFAGLVDLSDVRADTQAATTVRIIQFADDAYLTYTDSCAHALEVGAAAAGLKTKKLRADAPEAADHAAEAVDIRVLPTTASASVMTSAPDGFFVFDNAAPFDNPRAFAAFLKSPLYDELFKSRDVFSMFDDRLMAGLGYGSTSQIVTRDKPILTPDDLRGRTQVGMFGVWWYADLHEELGISHDPALGWAKQTIVGLREELAKTMGKYAPQQSFIVMPLLLIPKLVPAAQRTYVSMTMTHISLVSFIVDVWDGLPEAQQKTILATIKQAAQACSAQNFDAERAALDQLKRSGSTIVPVDTAPFQQLSSDMLIRDLDKAKEALRTLEAKRDPKGDEAKQKDAIDDATSLIKARQDLYDLYVKLRVFH